jgi:hypothetical protein
MKSADKTRDKGLQIFFPMRLAIIEVMPWESNEAAWNRHLVHYPQDGEANVKIFNRATSTCPRS